jgi:hypothetical protein
VSNPPCAECGKPGLVGVGDPAVWLCLAHFDERMAAIGAAIRHAQSSGALVSGRAREPD